MKKDLGNENVLKLLLELSIPAILSMLVAAIYNIVDRIFVGQIDPLGLTAIGITMPIQVIQMAFVLLVGVGSSTLISIKYGEGDIIYAEKLLSTSFIMIVISEIIVSAVAIVFLDEIFSLIGVSAATYDMARDYILVILISGAPGLTGYCLNNSVRSIGFAKESMKIVIISSLVNIALDALFILAFSWGVLGAALATGISQSLVTVFVIHFFISHKEVPIKLDLKILRLKDKSVKNIKMFYRYIREIISNGLPNFYMQAFGTAVSIILNRFIINYGGDYHMASITIISSINIFITMIIYGVSQGAQPIIGFNFGANKVERSLLTVKISTSIIFLISVIFLLVVFVFPLPIINMFTSDKSLIDITSHNIKIYLFGLPFIGFHSISTTYFQSVKNPRISSILYVLRYGGILIPLLYIIPNFLGTDGVYLSNALSDVISGSVAILFLTLDMRKNSLKINI